MRFPFWLVVGLLGMMAQASAGAEPALELGSRRKLLVDRYLIAEMRGMELKLHARDW